LAAIAAVSAGAAHACIVCFELPEKTLTDRVWAADAVVLARPDADNPFTFEPVEILCGQPGGTIPFLVDSVTRHAMTRDIGLHAVMLQQPDKTWVRGPMGGGDLAGLVLRMLAQEAAWRDAPDNSGRGRAFLALHAHVDPAIRALALHELARLPYAQLRDIDVALSVDWLTRGIADRSAYPLRPLLVWLLGLHDDPAAHAIVRERAFDMPAATRSLWLVALIEIDGVEAIDAILSASSRDDDRHAAVQALVAHADPARAVAPAVAAALRELAPVSPAIAANAVVGLEALGDFALASQVADMLMQGRVADPAMAFRLKIYLAASRSRYIHPLAAVMQDQR
jgi:hypothetical protein